MRMKDVFPPVNELLNMEPEDIAPFLLKYLNSLEIMGDTNQLNRYNLTLSSNSQLSEYALNRTKDVARVITEAWVWLEKEGLIAPKPDETAQYFFITRKGKQLKSHTDFTRYRFSRLLPKNNLDPILLQKVYPLYIRGDYDTAVFQAYKEVEVRIRKVGGYPNTKIGVALAREAFHPEQGKLTDQTLIKAEKEAMAALFAGAVGMFKNPSSHRNVDFEEPSEVVEVILFANYLLRLVDSRNQSLECSADESVDMP